jgi:anaerobic selenocysteine-containing dehydrogenase/Fe-S-cluster-containing dehydrogenase component
MSSDLSRRTFLKIMAVTSAAAAGCSQPPTRELMPYVIPDENVIPGVPAFYASSCRECPAGCGVVARVREGRVIKLEGNPLDPIAAGSLCARGQAALQGLYNPDRLAAPRQRAADGRLTDIAWDAGQRTFQQRLQAAAKAGADRVALLSPTLGPTLDRIADGWLQVWGSNRRLRYEALNDEPAHMAAQLCFGRNDLPVYQLDAGEVVLSFGADFLETWLSPVELARQYAAFRRPRSAHGGTTMGRAAYVGPRFGLTAANCDEWLACSPGTEALVALGVLHALVQAGEVRTGVDVDGLKRFVGGYDPAVVAERTGVPAAKIHRMAEWFARGDGAVALAGTADRATHVVAFVLNAVTGNLGRTMRFLEGPAAPAASGVDEIAGLVDAMRNGAIDVLVVAAANPAFAMPAFAEALPHVPFVVWCGVVPDETAALAHLLLPCHHPLESWTDLAPRPGVTLLGQPTMQPVFESRALGDILLASAGGTATAALPWPSTHAALEASWRTIHQQLGDGTSFEDFWVKVREAGGLFHEVSAAAANLLPEALTSPLEVPSQAPAGLTLVAFPHIFLHDGRGADKPWLQEIPEPVAQIVWDSWAEVHPETAKGFGIEANQILQLRSSYGHIEVPVRISDNVRPDVIAVPIGQGHTAYGRYASQRGANPWQLLPAGKRAVAVQAQPAGGRRVLVSPLSLPSMLDRPIVEAISLTDLARGSKPPGEGLEVPGPWQIRPQHFYPHHQWGMTIDLNACTGCSACVAACYAENNLAVVGKDEVARGHIMSWIRIERYVPKGPDAPPLYIMPMLCQQCDNAPCESVCPVYAASHTEEGLNAQVYNRCIGTRYCENNCPYKVRRFNWFKPEWPAPLNLQLNPDVTVRGAGVMEKCTFCIQRIRAAEMDAKADGRPVRDGEIVPACAQACPTKAITFGDMKDHDSAMMQRRATHSVRAYRALELLNTQPAIVYLRDVYRRPEEA